jgi:hypothetical protein
MVHRDDLPSQDVTVIEGLPVTSVARTIADLDAGGRLDLIGQAITEARRKGYISAAESQRLRRELKRHVEGLRAS